MITISREQREAYIAQLRPGRKRLVIGGRSCLNEADLDFAIAHMPDGAALPDFTVSDDTVGKIISDKLAQHQQSIASAMAADGTEPDGSEQDAGPAAPDYGDTNKPTSASSVETVEADKPKSFPELKKIAAELGVKFVVGMSAKSLAEAIAAAQAKPAVHEVFAGDSGGGKEKG